MLISMLFYMRQTYYGELIFSSSASPFSISLLILNSTQLPFPVIVVIFGRSVNLR